jgi:hypothetical protein
MANAEYQKLLANARAAVAAHPEAQEGNYQKILANARATVYPKQLHEILDKIATTNKINLTEDEKTFYRNHEKILLRELATLKQKMYDATNELIDAEMNSQNGNLLEKLRLEKSRAVDEYNKFKKLIQMGRQYSQQRQRTRKQRRSRNISLKRLRKN